MLTLIIIVVVLAVGAYVWINRTRLLAKALGQSESRVQRALERRKRR